MNMIELKQRIAEFIEQEARSCSKDFGCVTPDHVYRMWGGKVTYEDIAEAMSSVHGS